jgi:methylphosphotriester-DNA--protein-cysteine methyltransferase
LAKSSSYVASKNSPVFHRPDCNSAAKISAKNLIRYAIREEAIQAGKKPCHECNP